MLLLLLLLLLAPLLSSWMLGSWSTQLGADPACSNLFAVAVGLPRPCGVDAITWSKLPVGDHVRPRISAYLSLPRRSAALSPLLPRPRVLPSA